MSEDEIKFNEVHSKARSVVERAIGLLKGRFRCLCKQRMLHYKPEVCSKIINACASLHNICLNMNDILLEEELVIESNVGDSVQFPRGTALAIVGNQNRHDVIQFMNS